MRPIRLLVAAVLVATFSLAYQVTHGTPAAHAYTYSETVTGAAYCSSTNIYSACQSVELRGGIEPLSGVGGGGYDSTVTPQPWGQFTFTGVQAPGYYELILYGTYYSCSTYVFIPYSSSGTVNIGTYYCHS